MLTKLRVINNISVLKHETNAEKIVGLRARPPMSHRTCPTQRMSTRACDFPKRKKYKCSLRLADGGKLSVRATAETKKTNNESVKRSELDAGQSATLARPAAPLAAYVQLHPCTTTLTVR